MSHPPYWYPECTRCHRPADPSLCCVPGRFHGDPARGWRVVHSADAHGWRPAFGQSMASLDGQYVLEVEPRVWSLPESDELVRPYSAVDHQVLERLWERWHRHPWDLFWVQQFEPELYERWRVACGGSARVFYFGSYGKRGVR